MSKFRFTLFADIHYFPGTFYSCADRRLKEISRRAVESGSDFMLSLGDFNHDVVRFPEFQQLADSLPLPIYHLLGNHDTDHQEAETVIRAFHMPANYYSFDHGGFRFIMLDTNYYFENGEYIHYRYKNYFKNKDCKDNLPPEEVEFLRESIRNAPGPCLLFSHASLEREGCGGGIRNGREVRAILTDANRKERKVWMCFNGHCHRNYIRLLDGIYYYDFNSASYDWIDRPMTGSRRRSGANFRWPITR